MILARGIAVLCFMFWLAIILAACGTVSDVKPVPASELLIDPARPARLERKPLPQDEQITAWLNLIELQRIQRFKYQQLLAFGQKFYGWPIITEESNADERLTDVDAP